MGKVTDGGNAMQQRPLNPAVSMRMTVLERECFVCIAEVRRGRARQVWEVLGAGRDWVTSCLSNSGGVGNEVSYLLLYRL